MVLGSDDVLRTYFDTTDVVRCRMLLTYEPARTYVQVRVKDVRMNTHTYTGNKVGRAAGMRLGHKKGGAAFAGGLVLDIQVVVNINPTAQHDVCASMIHSYSHTVFTVNVPEQPNAQRPGTQVLFSPNRQT